MPAYTKKLLIPYVAGARGGGARFLLFFIFSQTPSERDVCLAHERKD